MTRRHQRFALRDVTFAGVSIPGATMDCWEDDHGISQWSARVVGRFREMPEKGQLAGRAADGRVFSGYVTLVEDEYGEGGRRERLLEFHGSGDLTVEAAQTS